jgi:hypothetical protein
MDSGAEVFIFCHFTAITLVKEDFGTRNLFFRVTFFAPAVCKFILHQFAGFFCSGSN